ncbi:UvrD-helicase domain-containing protein [Filomicrobium sp.]|uniref:ATP-dependent helicase n=1 Tax=Filomicrobium sp. TaxID=2024831 RepID=UPI0025888B35|nr:UvrD-helicase domain-containing protein [Filomicrobium sp.]MCV0369022.1 UvrD-helicase domain-containing protein [Filomicrobium sp.]
MSTNHKTNTASAHMPIEPQDDPPFDLPPNTESGAGTPGQAAPAHAQGSISQRALAKRPMSSSAAPYLDALNPEQRAAVEALEGPVLVLAGAGTGKTRVLTTRIAHILETGRAYPSQILAVTFTNKAAREMKERVERFVGGSVEGMPWLGTFHSIGVKILRRHAELVGLKQGFTILDVDDQLRLMKQVIEAEGLDKDRWPARQLAAYIDRWKNRGLTPEKVPAGEAHAFAGGKGRELYAAYQRRLKELNAADFGDLLLESLRLFMENPDILAQYHNRFRYILVDEYQDTNVAQYLWLRLLAQGSEKPNICCVGDDDQSIYGWRGAEVDNILRFEQDFPGATVIRLERNYRSTAHILATASHLITANENRLGKTLFTDGAAGNKVTVTGLWDDEEEARTIASNIEALGKQGHRLNEIAILVRASFQMRVLEDRFITTGLPYRVIGGPRFYERAEIKDAIAYLEVTANPANDLKFERIINVPKRGLGDKSVKRVRELARASEIPLFAAAQSIIETEELSGKARRSLSDLVRQFERWRASAATMPHTELAELILDESGYTQMWQADKSPQAQSRLENLKELVRFMHEFDTLQGFLEHVSLVMDIDNASDGDRVSIMTLHAAKGLEFDTVFLTGWEEGVFPSQRTLDESGQAGLEEERRLAYVGITRAKVSAHISFTQNRRNRGLYQSAIPSRFVDELPEAHVEVVEAKTPFGGAYQNFGGRFGGNPYGASRFDEAPAAFQSSYATPGWQRAQKQWQSDSTTPPRRRAAPRTIEGELVASSTSESSFEMGERVFHQKFGYGRISEIDGNKLTIDFEKSGRKRVVDSFVERH